MNLNLSRTDSSLLAHWWWSVDRWLLFSIFLLIFCGTVLITAASPAIAERLDLPWFYFVLRHLFYLGPTLIIMIFLSIMSSVYVRRFSIIVFAIILILLALVPIFGNELNGARRWISILGFSLQPSEFIKPTFAVVAAWLFSGQHRDKDFPGYLISCAMYAIIAGLLLLQPDLGMTIVVTFVWVVQFFMAGLPLSILAVLSVLFLSGLFIVYITFPHVSSRIDRFLDPQKGDTYQVDRSLEAFRHGGFFGTGPGQGEIKRVLPDAHADFIFAVAGEEFGFILTAFLVALFGFIVYRGMQRARESDNLFVMLAVAGLLTQFGIQALVHMGSSLHLLPAKGMTLPFVSYGGSSLLALGLGMGMVLGLSRHDSLKKVIP